MNPREIKNAMTISQMVEFWKPLKASSMDKVLVRTVAMMARIATEPMGRGFHIRPTMVATKIANRCQACFSTPGGVGKNQITAPTASVIKSGISLTSLELLWVLPRFAAATGLPPDSTVPVMCYLSQINRRFVCLSPSINQHLVIRTRSVSLIW